MIQFFRIATALIFVLLQIGPIGAQTKNDGITESKIVIDGQINAFRQRAHERAFSYASPSLQILFRDVDNFIRMVKEGYDPIYRARDWAFGRNQVDGNNIYQEVLISGPEGREWVALYTLQKQSDGNWKITGVRLLKSNAKTT